jgi:hypothetical protein
LDWGLRGAAARWLRKTILTINPPKTAKSLSAEELAVHGIVFCRDSSLYPRSSHKRNKAARLISPPLSIKLLTSDCNASRHGPGDPNGPSGHGHDPNPDDNHSRGGDSRNDMDR